MTEQLRTFSYGGGVQSTAALVLAARGEIPHRLFLFANTGDDSEMRRTLDYFDQLAAPFAAAHRLELRMLRRRRRDGSVETLAGRMLAPDSRSVPIPMRGSRSGAPGSRSCTADFKARVIAKALLELGATPENPARLGIGISTDELERATSRREAPHEVVEYPLLELGVSRSDCEQIIAGAGLPVPPKSACKFCPLRGVAAWERLADEDPDEFEEAAQLEDVINARRAAEGRDPRYLHRRLRPLREAITGHQPALDLEGPEACDSGHCWT